MITCLKCGVQNQLGRVFCAACGAKLDLTNLSQEQVSRMHERSWLLHHWRKGLWPVGLAIAAAAALAFWPRTDLLGKRGAKPHGVRLQQRLDTFKMLRPGQTLAVTIAEEDINGLIEFFKAGQLGVSSASVAFSPGCVRVRVIRNLGAFDVAKFRVEPKVSWDLVCVPVGRGLRVVKAWRGHLPLWGPFRTRAVRRVYAMAAAQAEWKTAVTGLDALTVGQGQMTLTVRK